MGALDVGARYWDLCQHQPPDGVDHDRDERQVPGRELEEPPGPAASESGEPDDVEMEPLEEGDEEQLPADEGPGSEGARDAEPDQEMAPRSRTASEVPMPDSPIPEQPPVVPEGPPEPAQRAAPDNSNVKKNPLLNDVPFSIRINLRDRGRPADPPEVLQEKKARTEEELAVSDIFATLEEDKGVYMMEVVLEGYVLAAFSERPKQVLNKAVKKGQVDINMRKATPEVKPMVAQAKLVEVNNWVHNE
eukprot:7274318-Pyramimonas_sp.AAC.1